MRTKILVSLLLVTLTVSLFLTVKTTFLPEAVFFFGVFLFVVGSLAVRYPSQGQETSDTFVKLALLGLILVAEGLLFLALRPFISG